MYVVSSVGSIDEGWTAAGVGVLGQGRGRPRTRRLLQFTELSQGAMGLGAFPEHSGNCGQSNVIPRGMSRL